MTKKLLSYQTKAVEATINHLLDNKEFKLQSPTGSGKTFIISQIIDKYLENEYLNIQDKEKKTKELNDIKVNKSNDDEY